MVSNYFLQLSSYFTDRIRRLDCDEEAHIVLAKILPLRFNFLTNAEVYRYIGTDSRWPVLADIRLSHLDYCELRDRLSHSSPSAEIDTAILRLPTSKKKIL